MKKTILITGAAGFIGSHLCRVFLGEGHRVICVDNLITGFKANIETLQSSPDFLYLHHDVSTPFFVDEKVDYVMHFASPASPADYHRYPIQTMKVGALGTHNALGFAKAKRAVFLLASTSEVYGDPLVHPQNEDYWGNVNPVGPRGVYDEAKRFAEALSLAYYRTHKIDVKIARIFNTYGPRMRENDGRAIPNFASQALAGEPVTIFGDGSQTRSFCYVDDTVEGLKRLLFSGVNEPVNLGNPAEMTVFEIAKMIIELTGSKSVLRFEELPQDDPRVRKPDIARARKYLGWEPKIGIREGLGKTIEYFKKLRDEKDNAR